MCLCVIVLLNESGTFTLSQLLVIAQNSVPGPIDSALTIYGIIFMICVLIISVLQQNADEAKAFQCKIVCLIRMNRFEEAIAALKKNSKLNRYCLVSLFQLCLRRYV